MMNKDQHLKNMYCAFIPDVERQLSSRNHNEKQKLKLNGAE